EASSFDIGKRFIIGELSGSQDPYILGWRLPITHKHFPLHSRGWVFQETLLSPRVIHFGDTELIWECTHITTCECGMVMPAVRGVPDPLTYTFHQPDGFGRKMMHNRTFLPNSNPESVKNGWRNMVHEYTRRSLTFADDIFPALAGLAMQMQSRRKCEYYAG